MSKPLKALTEYVNGLEAELKKISTPDIEWNRVTKEYDDTVRYPTVIRRGDDLFVSAEDGRHFADYYGEFRNDHGDPWIHESLETWAKSKGFYWEWENPGCIRLSQ